MSDEKKKTSTPGEAFGFDLYDVEARRQTLQDRLRNLEAHYFGLFVNHEELLADAEIIPSDEDAQNRYQAEIDSAEVSLKQAAGRANVIRSLLAQLPAAPTS